MIINQQNLRNLFIGYRAAFQNAFAGVQPDFNQFVLTVTSGNASEQYGWLGNSTAFREWLGDRVIQNLGVHDYTIKNKTFENTVGVPRESIEDDSYGLFTPLDGAIGPGLRDAPGGTRLRAAQWWFHSNLLRRPVLLRHRPPGN
ncbi:Mu-like prophage major head subunit gpT family protein [Pseudomonas aeruginosa]|uniref:Mu-like prophage major head subunit gpT family protein n=1 Tax=Pseudomonas aeruginosa TaxID=287 RepID=UPI001EDC9B07|nr:Mu-like prophage major head subunit gpT family protein [Pseudomonas aeruginosa]